MIREIFSELLIYICNHWISSFPSHTIRNLFYSKAMKFHIGEESTIFLGCRFDASKTLHLGDFSVINANCRLDTRGTITIGNRVSISDSVMILTADHEVDDKYFVGRTREVIIEDYAWIGTRALILPGVTIGKGAVIGAGSVVTKNVAPYAVVAGVPAKVIRRRSEDLDYKLIYFRKFH
jgi:acetyltransferase-like isoleucine patch superfamily enzyme